MYKQLVRPFFFSMQPETAHDLMRVVGRVAEVPGISSMLGSLFHVNDPRLEVHLAGLRFDNPVGLAAGLDKNAELIGLWRGLGFGHIEVGTVTARSQPGNPKPRIFRLAGDEALINRMGFPSEGADALQRRLQIIRSRYAQLPPLGANIGKSRVTEIDGAIDDYLYSFTRLAPLVDYLTVNVSSPNTPGLRQLQERDRLSALLRALQAANEGHKPIFVKVAPDLSFSAIEEVLQCCVEAGMSGIIATNTTIERTGLRTATSESGGLSGAPLRARALEVVRFISSQTRGKLALIGVGGIASCADTLNMLAAGAAMVQLYTGLIYEGPSLARSIQRGLSCFMDQNQCASLEEAVRVWSENTTKAA